MKRGYLIIPLVFSILLLIILTVNISINPIITVETDSMHPTFNPGDKLVINRNLVEEIKEGNIIAFDTFSEEFGIMAHRVIEVSATNDKFEIRTKGDNNDLPDPWKVDKNSFIGVVVEVNPSLLWLKGDVALYTLFTIAVISAILLVKESVRKNPNEI